MAVDNVYLELIKKAEENKGLLNDVTVKLTDNELEIITKKANNIGIDIGEFLRAHILKTAAFDESVFQEKKVKVKKVKAVENGVDNA